MIDFQTIFTVIYATVLAWLSLTVIQQGKKLAVMDSKLDYIEKQMEAVNDRIDKFILKELGEK